ncbi:MAG: DnaJ family molecular chaperone [Verrucomicrobiales bacterium]
MDAFAELGLPRSPLVDEAELERRFDALSRQHHPDVGGDPIAFARLGEARRLLVTPAPRLRHLLELVYPGTPLAGELPPTLVDHFAILGPTLQVAQQFIRKKETAASALARALLASEEMRHRETLESAAATLANSLAAVLDATRSWDGHAESLTAWARQAAFLERWQAQVRESLVRLSL